MVTRSVMPRSDLGYQFVEQLRVVARVDLALDDPAGPGYGQSRDLSTQFIARGLPFEHDLLFGGLHDACALGVGGALGGLDDLVGLHMGLLLDLLGARARLAHDLLDTRFGGAQIFLPAAARADSLRDL